MTRRRELEEHLSTLGEIREIMAAMKNLSFMETRKLSRFIDAQRQVVRSIEMAASDFFNAWPEFSPKTDGENRALILVGSERGFCGNYNEVLLQQLEFHCQQLARQPRLFVVGHKLAELLEMDRRVEESIAAASVAEEVPGVIQQVVERIDTWVSREPFIQVSVVHHDEKDGQVTSLLPPLQNLPPLAQPCRGTPWLYLEPASFVEELTDHYLFAVLHALFYAALLVEHQRRIQHLEGALNRLDERCGRLKKRRNVLRQEEITEEIEQVLLSAEAMAGSGENP